MTELLQALDGLTCETPTARDVPYVRHPVLTLQPNLLVDIRAADRGHFAFAWEHRRDHAMVPAQSRQIARIRLKHVEQTGIRRDEQGIEIVASHQPADLFPAALALGQRELRNT